jgi:hypothetical protein
MPARSASSTAALLLVLAASASSSALAAAEPNAAAAAAAAATASASTSSSPPQQPRVTSVDLWRRNFVLDNAGGASRARSNVAVSRDGGRLEQRQWEAKPKKAKRERRHPHAASQKKQKKQNSEMSRAELAPGSCCRLIPQSLLGTTPLESFVR